MSKILVTGGSGFIGSNFIQYLLTDSEIEQPTKVVNLDKITYAGTGRNIELMGLDKDPRYSFIKGDICDSKLVRNVFEDYSPDFVFNFAAESHVDRSIQGNTPFIKSNIEGAVNLLESSRTSGLERFVQISTDEVYGSISNGSFSEESALNPSSPYAASKAAAENMAMAYFKTHNVPVMITRSANNYGSFQFPEKLIPLFITNLIQGKKIPLMWSEDNPGLNVRDWLHVEDNCRAIWDISQKGFGGEIYNIPGGNEKTNAHIARSLLKVFEFGEEMIERVSHRKGHDFRYSISGEKLDSLGFEYKHLDFDKELIKTAEWYKQNKTWWGQLKNE